MRIPTDAAPAAGAVAGAVAVSVDMARWELFDTNFQGRRGKSVESGVLTRQKDEAVRRLSPNEIFTRRLSDRDNRAWRTLTAKKMNFGAFTTPPHVSFSPSYSIWTPSFATFATLLASAGLGVVRSTNRSSSVFTAPISASLHPPHRPHFLLGLESLINRSTQILLPSPRPRPLVLISNHVPIARYSWVTVGSLDGGDRACDSRP